ncbi:hypothetical protein ACC761_39925, partial [Rhizobium ruizarguesonis]
DRRALARLIDKKYHSLSVFARDIDIYEYRAWEKEADMMKPEGIVSLQGDVVAVYVLGRPDKRRRDCENCSKAISDTLTRWGV